MPVTERSSASLHPTAKGGLLKFIVEVFTDGDVTTIY